MKWVSLFIYCLIATHHVYSEMTEKQLKATQKLVRNTCQNKVKASSDVLDAMRAGNFDQGKEAQKRGEKIPQKAGKQMYHLLEKLTDIISSWFTKEGTFNWESGIQTLKSVAPEKIAGPGSVSVKNCKDAMKTTDNKCMGALEIARCIYNDNPQNYFLP